MGIKIEKNIIINIITYDLRGTNQLDKLKVIFGITNLII
jgi:hypothetical protein